MSGKNKNYNSIIFLTTLSVYLGLVLVSGSPQVFAYAATTKNFDIQQEIEFKEDLDNKPDDDLLTFSVIELVKDLDRLSKSNKYNWKNKFIYTIDKLNFCESDSSPAYSGAASARVTQKLSQIIEKHNVQIARNLNKLKSDSGLGGFYSGFPEGISFTLLTEHRTLNLKIKVNINSKEVSEKFFSLVNSSINQSRSLEKNLKPTVIYENTKITFENNQIFIVTNLPRAGIDSLLK